MLPLFQVFHILIQAKAFYLSHDEIFFLKKFLFLKYDIRQFFLITQILNAFLYMILICSP
jgi:hypothetical protein